MSLVWREVEDERGGRLRVRIYHEDIAGAGTAVYDRKANLWSTHFRGASAGIWFSRQAAISALKERMAAAEE